MLSLEENERTRAACVKYLQNRMINFYPENKKILKEINLLAKQLGGELQAPHIGKNYQYLVNLLGFKRTKDIAFLIRRNKTRIYRKIDNMLYFLSS